MKVILAMVMSLDGKTTKWDEAGIYNWTSPEDREYFFSLREKNDVIIMGRKTFDAAKSVIKLSPRCLRIVMTRTPQKYSNIAVKEMLEFTDEPSSRLIEKLNKRGDSKVLVVGGEQVNFHFLKEKRIDEIWITIEPLLFGLGNSLVSPSRLNITMELKGVRKLNKNGTLLLKYRVIYNSF